MTDAPSAVERLASALGSRNLIDRRTIGPRIAETDLLRVAAAGFAARTNPLAMAVYELRYRQPLDMERAIAVASALVTMVERQAKRERWYLRRRNDAQRVVGLVLSWWVADVCPACDGRRFETVPGTPMLSDRHCHACGGDGKRPLRAVLAEAMSLRDREPAYLPAEWVTRKLDELEAQADDEYVRRLGRKVVAAFRESEAGLCSGL